MARYIDADELRRRVKEKTNPYGKPTLDYESGVKVLNMIDNAPTADVAPKSEVIRCKDCINCDHCYPAKTIGEEAVEGWYCISHKRYVKPDDFCSFAELKKKHTEGEE